MYRNASFKYLNIIKIFKSSLLVKGILVEKVGAVELLAVSLVEGDYIFLSLEYFNLGK